MAVVVFRTEGSLSLSLSLSLLSLTRYSRKEESSGSHFVFSGLVICNGRALKKRPTHLNRIEGEAFFPIAFLYYTSAFQKELLLDRDERVREMHGPADLSQRATEK